MEKKIVYYESIKRELKCRKPERQPCTIFTTPGAMWYGVKMCGKAYGVRSCYDGRGMCTTLPENLDHVVLLLFFVN